MLEFLGIILVKSSRKIESKVQNLGSVQNHTGLRPNPEFVAKKKFSMSPTSIFPQYFSRIKKVSDD